MKVADHSFSVRKDLFILLMAALVALFHFNVYEMYAPILAKTSSSVWPNFPESLYLILSVRFFGLPVNYYLSIGFSVFLVLEVIFPSKKIFLILAILILAILESLFDPYLNYNMTNSGFLALLLLLVGKFKTGNEFSVKFKGASIADEIVFRALRVFIPIVFFSSFISKMKFSGLGWVEGETLSSYTFFIGAQNGLQNLMIAAEEPLIMSFVAKIVLIVEALSPLAICRGRVGSIFQIVLFVFLLFVFLFLKIKAIFYLAPFFVFYLPDVWMLKIGSVWRPMQRKISSIFQYD